MCICLLQWAICHMFRMSITLLTLGIFCMTNFKRLICIERWNSELLIPFFKQLLILLQVKYSTILLLTKFPSLCKCLIVIVMSLPTWPVTVYSFVEEQYLIMNTFFHILIVTLT